MVAKLLKAALPKLRKGTLKAVKQDEKKATYFGGRKPEDGAIDWGKTASEVRNLVRGVTRPYPGAFSYLGEKKYIFWGSYKLSDDPSVDYGIYALEVPDDGLAIKEGASKVKVAGNQIEGTMVTERDGWYYLFASTGQTLAGTSSDYRVVVGRSDNVLGPYTGPDGTPMLDNDGYNNYILSGDGSTFFGTGHNSGIVTDDAGQSWMAYHTLWTGNHLNVRVVCVDRVMWLNGWPSLVTGHPVTDGAGPMFKINL